MECPNRQLYGLQYHPEVQHSERGTPMLRHFLLSVAKMKADWKIEKVLEEEMEKIRRLVRSCSLFVCEHMQTGQRAESLHMLHAWSLASWWPLGFWTCSAQQE